jgi:drug/metabolite transporter (DMT)-like permease|uniref:EamA domain-containing protein n=1 Tax=viral metagenome TaxID=1070528 RepID=A0A6C0KJK7_9ZZZZ
MLWAAIAYSSLMASIDIASLGLAKAAYTGAVPVAIGLAVSVLLYAIQPLLFYNALSFEGLAVVNLLWNVISSIVVTLLGILYFKEKLTNLKLLGAAFSIVAIWLLGMDS